jgi:7-cyano-7-deazaguanine reductase
MSDYTSAKILGGNSSIPPSPEKAELETVANPHKEVNYSIRFTCPEFTSLCPVTGQPDFAHIVIDYIPNHWIIESKSLKLFLHSFRSHPDFHEACTIYIAKRFIATCQPKWLRIGGYWYPRGGIPIDIFYQTSSPPEGAFIPELKVEPYRGRG